VQKDRLAQFHPAASSDRGLTLHATPEEARAACFEVAADLGLKANCSSGDPLLTFRDPFRWQAFPVDIDVHVANAEEGAQVYVAGSSLGGRNAHQTDYVRLLVNRFASRLEQEMHKEASRAVEWNAQRRRHRALLLLLRLLWWLPVVALVPMVVLPLALGSDHSKLYILGWIWLMLGLPSVGEVLRRRLVGTSSSGDYTNLAVGVGAALVCTAFFLGFSYR
jgi:hypothetical protein